MLRGFRGRGARFRRETPIGPYIADFAWLSARIIIEVDGDSHAMDAGVKHDQKRDSFLLSQGFRIMRFDNNDVICAEEGVYLEIERALTQYLLPEPQP